MAIFRQGGFEAILLVFNCVYDFWFCGQQNEMNGSLANEYNFPHSNNHIPSCNQK